MPVQTLTRQQFVDQWIAAYCASLNIVGNFVEGDIELAIADADSGQATTLQLMAVSVVNFARAQTSRGPDLDSWMAQFAFPRKPATQAFGTVTFSTPVVNLQQAIVPVGTLLQVPGGSIVYRVIADPSQPAFNSGINAYVLPAGQLSINATAEAIGTGANFNVQSGQITQIQNTIFGIPAVTNPTVIDNGSDPESDTAYRARFILYINNLSKGTYGAILEALESIGNIKISLLQNVQMVGNPPTSENTPYYGNVVALIDDGSGSPPQSLFNAALAAMQATIAWGMQYQILPPAIVTPPIELNIHLIDAPTESTPTIRANVQKAILNYVNLLPIGGGGGIRLGRLVEIAIDADPNVDTVDLSSVKINGVQADYTMQPYQEALLALTNITVGTY